MRKSEAIKIIEDSILEDNPYSYNLSNDQISNISKKVLENMLKGGFLPPYVKLSHINASDFAFEDE